MTTTYPLPQKFMSNMAFITKMLVVTFLTTYLLYCNLGSDPKQKKGVAVIHTPENDTINLAMVGDLMCHAYQFEKARKDSGFDFHPTFAPIKQYLSAADLTFGNLETVTAGKAAQFTGYPMFNTPVEYLDALKDAGFDVLTTANNHSMDRKLPGVSKTIEEIEKRGFQHTGTARSKEEREKPLIINHRSIKMGVLAYTFSTNGITIPVGHEYAVNMIDTTLMKKDIEATKKAGADYIAVFLHWGDEYQRFPNDRQKMIAKFLHTQGVSLIMGSHPHVLQPVQWMSEGGKNSFTIYSMGNFISGQRKPFTDCGMILRIQLIKNKLTGEISWGKTDYIPTYVSTSGGYRILPVADAIKAIQSVDKTNPAFTASILEQTRIQQVWKETTQHMDQPAIKFKAAE